MKKSKYSSIGRPIITEGIARISRSLSSSFISLPSSLQHKIPSRPPRLLRIRSSMSAAPMTNAYCNNSVSRLVANITAKFGRSFLFFCSRGRNSPSGKKAIILPNTLLNENELGLPDKYSHMLRKGTRLTDLSSRCTNNSVSETREKNSSFKRKMMYTAKTMYSIIFTM